LALSTIGKDAMQIIDRYMLRQFLKVFVICFLSLTGLFVVIDGFGNLEEFITHAKSGGGGLLSVMGKYYAYRTLWFFDRTSGILALIAAMFTVTWIQRHNELTALQAAGIAKGRVIKPILIAAVVVAGLAVMNRELMIPSVREQLGRSAQDLAGSAGKTMQMKRDYDTGIALHGQKAFADKRRILLPSFHLPAELDEHGKQLTAEEAYYLPRNGEIPSGYKLVDIRQPKGLDRKPSLFIGDRPIIFTPVDVDWLKPGEVFVVSNVGFEQLAGGSSWWQYSSIWELIRGLRNPSADFSPNVRVAIHSRIVQPFLDATLLLMGLPLVLARGNRNVFMAIGLCCVIVAGFMTVNLGCQYLGSSGLMPAARAAWLPLILSTPLAAWMCQPLLE
jgi:lipopolysaccharide export system permease protein